MRTATFSNISDFPVNISSIKLFADDCVLYHIITSPSDQFSLQSDINAIY